MRRNRYSEEQIIGILKEVQEGKSAREVIRHYGIAEATFYRWRERYAGVGPRRGGWGSWSRRTGGSSRWWRS